MTFPSAACQTCKDRRIKCDETKPSCRKCIKSKRICLDARAIGEADFSIHDEGLYASGVHKRPRGPRSSLTILRPHQDLSSRALSYYYQCHLQDLKDVPNLSTGLSQCVTAWTVSGKTCTMVDLALSVTSLAIFSRTHLVPSAAAKASSNYCRLLRVARERIGEVVASIQEECEIDACLLAMILMGRYEGSKQRPDEYHTTIPLGSLQTWSHLDGARSLLKLWYDSPNNYPATYIIKHARRGLIKSDLIRSRPLPTWLLDGSRFGEEHLELQWDRLLVQIVNLNSASRRLLQPDDNYSRTAEIEKLKEEAFELNESLQLWSTQIPRTCRPERYLTEPGPYPRPNFYSPVVYVYPTPGYAAAWSQYYALKMLINSIQIRLLNLCPLTPLNPESSEDFPSHAHQRLTCLHRLESTADELAFSLPFCLERIKVDGSTVIINEKEDMKPYLANMIAWPLTIASCLESVDDVQRRWFRSEIARLGRVSGDGILEFAETDQWVVI